MCAAGIIGAAAIAAPLDLNFLAGLCSAGADLLTGTVVIVSLVFLLAALPIGTLGSGL